MFSTGHLIFIGISVVLIVFGILTCLHLRPSMKRLLRVCFVLGVISEVIKFFSVVKIVPVVHPALENGEIIFRETGIFWPYLETEHLPFELCSLQLLFMPLALVIKNDKIKHRLYALMYLSGIAGGMMAIILAEIAPEFSSAGEMFSSFRVWQFFFYHAMVVVLGVYIGVSKECDIRFRDWRGTVLLLVCLDVISFYLNSIMSIPYYYDGKVVGMAYGINYFSTYRNPFGIVMDTKEKWILYLLIRIAAALVVIFATFAPLLRKEKKR